MVTGPGRGRPSPRGGGRPGTASPAAGGGERGLWAGPASGGAGRWGQGGGWRPGGGVEEAGLPPGGARYRQCRQERSEGCTHRPATGRTQFDNGCRGSQVRLVAFAAAHSAAHWHGPPRVPRPVQRRMPPAIWPQQHCPNVSAALGGVLASDGLRRERAWGRGGGTIL